MDKYKQIQAILACPICIGEVDYQGEISTCLNCGQIYQNINGILDLRLPSDAQAVDLIDWSEHWSGIKQASLAQRFFSQYRRLVFSRTVEYYFNRYFSTHGIFLEAGAGTSETSIRINKLDGQRLLVAMDIYLPVLTNNDPVMDIGIGGNIEHLPFKNNSIDGIWNVGVMEHFPRDKIDRVLLEFFRVLKPGGDLLLLWPGTKSIPQKVLRMLERIINLRKSTPTNFRFHPPEINQLKSIAAGSQVLERNGYSVSGGDSGLRSLMAFITIIGKKPDEEN
jgi:SAM-dependent methyltransferase